MESTATEVRRILVEDLGCDLNGVGQQDSLLEAGILDSIAVLELVSAIERRFGIHIADDDLMPETLDSVDAITALLEKRNVAPGA